MRRIALLLLILVPTTGAQVALVEEVTAWDAQIQGTFGGLVLAGHEGLVVSVDAEELVVRVYEGARVRVITTTHWTHPSVTKETHHNALLTAWSYNGNLVLLDQGSSFQARGQQIHVGIPTRSEISDRDVAEDPPRRSTVEDLVVRDEVDIEVRGDFLLGVDQYLVHVDDGDSHVYDSRTDNADDMAEVDPDARHVVVEARNATLRVSAPATGAGGGLYFPHAEIQAERITGFNGEGKVQLLVEREGDVITATPIKPPTPASTTPAPPSGGDTPERVLAMAGLLFGVLAVGWLAWAVLWGGWRDAARWERLASRFLNQDRDLLGLAATRVALFITPSSWYGWQLRAWAHSRRHDWERVLAYSDRAFNLGHEPTDRADAALEAARACAAMERGEEAGRWLTRVFENDELILEEAADDPLFARVRANAHVRSLLGIPTPDA